MQKKEVTIAARRIGLRLIVTDRVKETDEDKARKFADLLERQYDLVSRNGVGGLHFSNCIEVDDFPEPVHVARAMEILNERGYDGEPTDCSTDTQRRGIVWVTPQDPQR
jgi:hypothetical protein